MTDTQPSLLTWPAAPTTDGPRTAASDGERTRATPAERWAAFVAAHPRIADAMLNRARDMYAGRCQRVSAKAIAEWARAEFKTPINNTAVAAMAAWLVERDPALASVIERRTRTR